jgi:hypothetical protein
MLDLNGRWQRDLSSKSRGFHHRTSPAATINGPSKRGTTSGGTSQGPIPERSDMIVSFGEVHSRGAHDALSGRRSIRIKVATNSEYGRCACRRHRRCHSEERRLRYVYVLRAALNKRLLLTLHVGGCIPSTSAERELADLYLRASDGIDAARR